MGARFLFIFGLGYVGQAFASHFQERKEGRVAGTTRDLSRAASFQKRKIEVFSAFDESSIKSEASQATHILYTCPPFEKAPDSNPLLHLLKTTPLPKLQWVGYLSSTSVYGDHQGKWVDEGALTHPLTLEGERRLKAEGALKDLAASLFVPISIFRLAGIYGPGRNALHNILHGKAQRILAPGVVFSRVHLLDILLILEASIDFQTSTDLRASMDLQASMDLARVYNVADDEPASTADVVAYGCELLKRPVLPLVPLCEANLSEMGRDFYRSSKKVSNHKVKKTLGVTLQFPSYKKGLEGLLDQELSLFGEMR